MNWLGVVGILGKFCDTDTNQFYVVQILLVAPVGYVWERVT